MSKSENYCCLETARRLLERHRDGIDTRDKLARLLRFYSEELGYNSATLYAFSCDLQRANKLERTKQVCDTCGLSPSYCRCGIDDMGNNDAVMLIEPTNASFSTGRIKCIESPTRVYVQYSGQCFGTWTTLANLMPSVAINKTGERIETLHRGIKRLTVELRGEPKHRDKIVEKLNRLQDRLTELRMTEAQR